MMLINPLYKRIYHNVTISNSNQKELLLGYEHLITSYGIPDTILRISEFGGKDKGKCQMIMIIILIILTMH